MRIALINSGLGLLAAAAALHRRQPDADLVLATDPDGMPWGPRTPDDIVGRAMLCARAAAAYEPDVLVMACNTGSVHALEPMRAEFEPDIPVIGTVPAIKPAAAAHQLVAIWATVATTASAYQRRLITEFGGSALVTPVACPGLADAVDAGDEAGTHAAVTAAAAQTPASCQAIVLGCTEYELAADLIRAAVPRAVMFGSADAVAAQALRRVPGGAQYRPVGSEPACASLSNAHLDGAELDSAQLDFARPDCARLDSTRLDSTRLDSTRLDSTRLDGTRLDGTRFGTVRVLLSGRPAPLPPAALRYPEGRLLAPLVLLEDANRERAEGPAVTG